MSIFGCFWMEWSPAQRPKAPIDIQGILPLSHMQKENWKEEGSATKSFPPDGRMDGKEV